MRVGLNATCLNEQPSGARQRFVGIYGELIRRNPQIEFVIYEPADCSVAGWFADAPNVTARRTPIPSSGRLRKAVRSLGYWRAALSADRLDLFEMFNLPLVRAPACPTVLTVHDTRHVRSDVRFLRRAVYAQVWRRALAGADHVITVSDTIREEVLALRPSAKVTTIYNGIDVESFAGVHEGRLGSGASRDFLLAVGHIEPRKNYGTLIRALRLLRDQGYRKELVIVGNDGGNRAEIQEMVARLDLADSVRLLSNVPHGELRDLYDSCELVVFPSLYEGFGIPVLEAMAARKPLILSDIPAFLEITEGRGEYFSPLDDEALARLIREVGSDPQLRARLVRYGEARVRSFAFPALAEQVARLYGTLA